MVGSRGCAPAASPSDPGRATLRPCAPQYALRDSASVANSSAVWAQPPRGASAPAFSPVPPGSRSAHFLCVVGRLEVCLEGTMGARRQPDGAEQLALGPRVGSGAAGGLRTPAPRVRSTLLPRPSCSPLHGVCAASEVHGVCLCTTDSEQGFVYAYAGLTRMKLLCAHASLGVQPPSVCPRQYMQRSSGRSPRSGSRGVGSPAL